EVVSGVGQWVEHVRPPDGGQVIGAVAAAAETEVSTLDALYWPWADTARQEGGCHDESLIDPAGRAAVRGHRDGAEDGSAEVPGRRDDSRRESGRVVHQRRSEAAQEQAGRVHDLEGAAR